MEVKIQKEQQEQEQEQQQHSSRFIPPAPRLDPWLIFLHGRRGHLQTFFTLSENRYHVKNIPEMRRKYIATSSYGWMLLLDDFIDNCPSLLNPISMEKIQLPLWRNFTYNFCLLTSPPNDPSCIILSIDNSQEGLLSFMYCGPSDDNWVYDRDVAIINDEKLLDVICCDGKIYGLYEKVKHNGRHYYWSKTLGIIDVGATVTLKEFGGEAIPEPLAPNAYRNGWVTKLVESCGELYALNMFYLEQKEVRHIEVLKMDFDRKVWVRVKNLGDRAFFISRDWCSSCSAKKSGIKGNTIYYMLREDTSLYAFNLEDRSITISLPCPNVKNCWSQLMWVLPLT